MSDAPMFPQAHPDPPYMTADNVETPETAPAPTAPLDAPYVRAETEEAETVDAEPESDTAADKGSRRARNQDKADRS